MFCYIKYSVIAIHTMRLSKLNSIAVGSSDAVIRKAKSTVVRYKTPSTQRQSHWSLPPNKPPTKEDSSSSKLSVQIGQEDQVSKYTNQLAFEKSMNMINTIRKRGQTSADYIERNKSQTERVHIDSLLFSNEICEVNKSEVLQPVASEMCEIHLDWMESKIPLPPRPRTKSIKQYRKSTAPTMIPETNSIIMINPDCYMQILIDYIYEQLHIDKSLHIDVCDEDGNMMRLFELKPYDNAKLKLEHRKTYTLVAYEMDPVTNSYITLAPLIKRTSKRESELLLKLKHSLNNGSKTFKTSSTHSLYIKSVKSVSKPKPKLILQYGRASHSS